MKKFDRFEKLVSVLVDVMLAILVIIILIAMGEAIYQIVVTIIPLPSVNGLEILIEEIATLFILLEVILMLVRYVKEGHHIPVRYLILISITAISRELLLAHGGGLETMYLSISVLILVGVLILLERVKAFHTSRNRAKEENK